MRQGLPEDYGPAMTRRRLFGTTCALLLSTAAVALAGCSAPGAAPRPSASVSVSVTPTVAAYDPELETWFDAPFDPAEEAVEPDPEGGDAWVEGDLAADDGSAVALPDAAIGSGDEDPNAPVTTGDEPDPGNLVDPCLLVSISEWVEFAGADGTGVHVLEPYADCLYVNGADVLRLSVSVVPIDEVADLESALAEGVGVPGTSRETTLLEAYPLPFATTAASRATDGRLILVSLYSRDPGFTDQAIQAAAAAWASAGAEMLG